MEPILKKAEQEFNAKIKELGKRYKNIDLDKVIEKIMAKGGKKKSKNTKNVLGTLSDKMEILKGVLKNQIEGYIDAGATATNSIVTHHFHKKKSDQAMDEVLKRLEKEEEEN